MAMPVHTCRMVIKELHTIHSHIGNTRFGIFGADHREGDKWPSIGSFDVDTNEYYGKNIMGRLLMELREKGMLEYTKFEF